MIRTIEKRLSALEDRAECDQDLSGNLARMRGARVRARMLMVDGKAEWLTMRLLNFAAEGVAADAPATVDAQQRLTGHLLKTYGRATVMPE